MATPNFLPPRVGTTIQSLAKFYSRWISRDDRFSWAPTVIAYIVLSPLSAPAYAAITCTNTKSQIQRPLVHKMMVGVGFCDATITALSYYPSATRNNTGHHKLSRFM